VNRVMLTAIASLGIAQAASAAPVTFFGVNTSPSATVTGDPVTERGNFLNALSGSVGTEDFEGFARGTSNPLSLSFTGSTGNITATLSGGGSDIDTAGSGRFATSGTQFVETSGGGDFTIDFSTAISAFGFYGTDIGDISGDLILTLTDTSSAETEFTLSTGGDPNGSLLFWGFADTMNSYTKIEFTNTGSGDIFGFDDMTIGDAGQVILPPPPAPVPLPASSLLLLAGLGGFGLMKRRS